MQWSEIKGFGDGFIQVYDLLLAKYNEGSFVEVGVCFGRSIAYLASCIKKENKNIRLYAVDIFHDKVWRTFQQNIFCCNLNSFISPIRAPSNIAYQIFPENSIDFVYVDADHKFSSVLDDLTNWWSRVKVGGYLAGDDLHISSVKQAVNKFFGSGNYQVVGYRNYLIQKQ